MRQANASLLPGMIYRQSDKAYRGGRYAHPIRANTTTLTSRAIPPQEPSQAPGEERGVTQLNTRMVALPEVLTYRSSGVAHR